MTDTLFEYLNDHLLLPLPGKTFKLVLRKTGSKHLAIIVGVLRSIAFGSFSSFASKLW